MDETTKKFWKKQDDNPNKFICTLSKPESECIFDGGCGNCSRYHEWKNNLDINDLIKIHPPEEEC